MRYKTFILFGAPGSGKGTQGKTLGSIPRFYLLKTFLTVIPLVSAA